MCRRASTAGCADATSPRARGRPRLAAHPRLRRRAGRTPAAAVVDQFAVPASAATVTHRVPGRACGGAHSAGRVRAAAVARRARSRSPRWASRSCSCSICANPTGSRDIPARTWVLTAVLGIGLGVGWVLLTGGMMARSYGIALGAGIVGARMLRMGIGIPLGGVILMLMPAVIVRLLRPPHAGGIGRLHDWGAGRALRSPRPRR